VAIIRAKSCETRAAFRGRAPPAMHGSIASERSTAREIWFHAGMKVVEFGRLTDEHRRALEGDEPDPFDSAEVALRFRSKERHVGLQDESGRLVASTGMVVVDVQVEVERFPVVGIGGVIVSAPYRGRGLARRVVEVALARARHLGPRFSILFCHEDRAGLYRKLGFVQLPENVRVKQPGGYAPMTQRTMWIALHGEERWPSGDVVVHSLPF
jgi:predicted N-acetyltransferase YhbS